MADLGHEHPHGGVGGADGQGGDEPGEVDDGEGGSHGYHAPAEEERKTCYHGHSSSSILGRQESSNKASREPSYQIQRCCRDD